MSSNYSLSFQVTPEFGPMRLSHSFPLLALAFLSACGPVGFYYREGATVESVSRAQTGCEASSLKQAPVATQVRQRPPTYWPGRVYCDGVGCVRGPGYWVDGGFYTVDTNSELRGRITSQCMADQGFSRVELPRCTGGTSSIPSTLPGLDQNTCAQQLPDGRWRVAGPLLLMCSR